MKLLSFADEVDDSEEGEPAQQWASGARRAATKSKSSHDLLEDPALARDPAYDIAALRDSPAASSANKAADDTKPAEQKGGPAISGAAAGDELEDEEVAEAKRYPV